MQTVECNFLELVVEPIECVSSQERPVKVYKSALTLVIIVSSVFSIF